MKNKKIIILLGIIGALVVLALALFFILRKKDDRIYIYFDSDGGTTVEKIEIKKGESIKLPDVKKEGYNFVGWYDGDIKVSNNKKYNETTTLFAKWVKEDAKTYTITFDSDGGTQVDNLIVECDTELKLPANPTKKGYEFIAWVDKNETPILDKALLACEDVTLKATWKKVEEKKTEPTKEITYSCPTGYKLNGTKCEFDDTVREKCPDGLFEYNGICVTVNYSVRKTGDYSCPNKNITVGSYAGNEAGELVFAGTYFCYYHKLSYNSQSQCESLTGQFGNFVWRSSNNTCYVTRTTASMSCDNLSGYLYISDPNQFDGVNGLNGGCFPTTSKVKYCLDGFTLQDNNTRCVKTIDATAN